MTYVSASPSREPHRREAFVAGLNTLARRLRFSVLDLSDAERDRLRDIHDGRFPMTTLLRLCGICRRSLSEADRRGLAGLVLAECIDVPGPSADTAQEDLFAIAREENLIEADANVATLDALMAIATSPNPCPKVIARGKRYVDRHIHGLFRLSAALQRRLT